MNKNIWKFGGGFTAIIALTLLSLAVSNYFFNSGSKEEREAKKQFEELKKQYENDIYGGKTPEETLQLFISALEKGDVDLASKYFVLEKQEEWSNKLKIAQNNNIKLFIDEASKAELGKETYPGNYLFTVFNEDNREAEFIISLVFNKDAKIWKIEDL